jgi:retron-type reverse transcriptase
MVMEPIFERDFAAHSYGFRPNRGCKDALRRMHEPIKAGHVLIVDADLKSYFDTIPKDRLMALIRQKVEDTRVLALIESFLNQGVLDGDKRMGTRTRYTAGRCGEPAAEQHLSQSTRPPDGRAGL